MISGTPSGVSNNGVVGTKSGQALVTPATRERSILGRVFDLVGQAGKNFSAACEPYCSRTNRKMGSRLAAA